MDEEKPTASTGRRMVAAHNRPAERPEVCFPELVHKFLLPKGSELVKKGICFVLQGAPGSCRG